MSTSQSLQFLRSQSTPSGLPCLLILDVTGLLCCKEEILCTKYKGKQGHHIVAGSESDDVLILHSYRVYRRPSVRLFIKKLLHTYTVAIFSSTTEHNLHVILDWVLGPELMTQLYFVWDRSRTRDSKNPRDNTRTTSHNYPGTKDHHTTKSLRDIWQDTVVNAEKIWDEYNTLIVDHDQTVVGCNDNANYLIVAEWYDTSRPISNIVAVNVYRNMQWIENFLSLIENKFAEMPPKPLQGKYSV